MGSDGSVVIDGQEIAYQESAGTGRPVVLVHSNSTSSRTWRLLLDGPFGRRFRCLALDLPGHGRSARASDPATYSLPGYAALLAKLVTALGARAPVVVGWSLGGHVAIEALPLLEDLAGLLVFGAPPIGNAAALAEAFLPNPATNVGFAAEVSEEQARTYAASFFAPGSPVPLEPYVAEILATDGAARQGLLASIGAGRFADEVALVAGMRQPIAMLHGRDEQLVSLPYLRKLSMPTLWCGEVQVIGGAGHAPHVEAPEEFRALLEAFVADLP